MLSGCVGTFIATVSVFRDILGIDTKKEGVFELCLVPAMLTLYTGAYIMRGFRLLVMYNPHMRSRWGSFSKELYMVRALVISCVVLEGIIWTASYVVGIRRSACKVYIHPELSDEETQIENPGSSIHLRSFLAPCAGILCAAYGSTLMPRSVLQTSQNLPNSGT